MMCFAIVSFWVLFFAQGYDFDWKKNKIIENGGIYIKTSQPNIDVYIDNKYINRTDSFSRDLLIQKLTPEEHLVRVQKDGYFSWEKSLKVDEKNVAKAQNIILFPENITFKEISANISKTFEINNQKILILTKSNELSLLNTDSGQIENILSAEEMKNVGKIKRIEFSPNSKKALIVSENLKYFLLLLEDKTANKIKNIKDFDKNSQKISFNGDGYLYYLNKNNLYSLNLDNGKKELIKEELVSAFGYQGDGLYTLEDGILIRTNIYLKTFETMTKEPFLFKKNITYDLKILEGRIFLTENNKAFYYYNGQTKSFEKVIESTQGEIKYKIWSDKIIFNNDNELWLMLLKDYESPFFKKSDSFIFLSRFSEKISDVAWIDDDYFATIIGGKIRISEIDIRDKINFFELKDQGYSNIWFNKSKKALISIKENKIYESDKVIP